MLAHFDVSKSAGPEGMVGGQVADIQGENQTYDLANWNIFIIIKLEDYCHTVYWLEQ